MWYVLAAPWRLILLGVSACTMRHDDAGGELACPSGRFSLEGPA